MASTPHEGRWRCANCILLTSAKKRKLLAKFRLVDAADWGGWLVAGESAPKHFQYEGLMMKYVMMLPLAVAWASSAPVTAQPAPAVVLNCEAGSPAAGGAEAPNLHGHWDFLMLPRGLPSFGLMSIGFVGSDYGGSLAPVRTAPVVLRSIDVTGGRVRMVVASTEGDVVFDGRLSTKGDLMCGTVTYHGGETFPMVAQKRPSTYQSPSQAQRRR